MEADFFPHETEHVSFAGSQCTELYRTEEGSFLEAIVAMELWVLYCPWKQRWHPEKWSHKRKMRFLVHIPHFQAVFLVQILRGCISWEIMSLSLCWVRFFHCEAKAKESKQWLGAPSGVKGVPQYMNYIWSASSWCCFYFKPTHFFWGGPDIFGECHCFRKRSCILSIRIYLPILYTHIYI